MEPSEVLRVGSLRRNSSVWRRGDESIFSRSSRDEDDEEALKWAALEKLPTFDRVRRGILALADDGAELQEVDIERLGFREKRALIERLVRVADEDNERFLLKLRDRIDRLVDAGEMLVGPARALFMDEISTGLDSSTTFQIVNSLRQSVHILSGTAMISLLQPAPETYDLFDDIILLSDGLVVYQGPRDNVLEFFESMGFRCPERKGVADFLQEVGLTLVILRLSGVTPSLDLVGFTALGDELSVPFDKNKSHPAALTTTRYGVSNKEVLKANIDRELLLMKRNSFVYIFKATQLTIMAIVAMTVFLRTKMPRETETDGLTYLGALFFAVVMVMFNGFSELAMTLMKLPVFFKQRDLLFYPAWSYTIPTWILKIPIAFIEVAVWVFTTYYVIGFDPNVGR
ncbi:hypothetical protein BHE74_00023699 [Ensete ventricosum]|nr:hypothetical protein BHE74_00023699 [Ensete ventricosum]